MRYQDLSEDSKALVGMFQNQRLGTRPEGVLGLGTALAIRAPLNKISTGDEYGVSRSIILKRHFEREFGMYMHEVLDKFLEIIPFDFKLTIETASDLYALRYLQAFDINVFINSSYRLDFYIENNFLSYRARLDQEENIAKEFIKILMEKGGTVSQIAHLFGLFMDDLEKAGVVKLNRIQDVKV